MRSPPLAVEGKKLIFSHNGKIPVLNEVSINVRKGRIYGLLGPSGCGKTTLLRCILGRLLPESGEIRIYGRKPGETGFCIPGKGVGYMPQELALYTEITVEENLQYFGQLFEMSSDEINERISFLIDLLEIPDKKCVIKNLSGGQMRRVSFAAALIHKPPLLVLDEPTVGVDPVLRRNVWAHLRTLAADDHVTIILTTHYVEEACNADMVGLMRNGCLVAEENPIKLIEQHRLNSLEEVFFKLSKDNDELCSLTPKSTEASETPLDSPSNKDCISLSASAEKIHLISSGSFYPNTDALHDTEFGVSSNNGTHNSSTCSGEEIRALLYYNETKLERFKERYYRTKALMKRELIERKRNTVFVAIQFLVPAFQMILICMCIGLEPFNLPMAIVNMESEHGFTQALNNRTITQMPYSNISSAVNSVKLGETFGVLYIEQNFTQNLLKRILDGRLANNGTIQASSVELRLDMTSQQITFTLWYSIIKSLQEFCEKLLIAASENSLLAESPVMFADPVYGSKESRFLDFIAPNALLIINYFMAFAVTGLSMFFQRKHGLLERSMVAGVHSSEIFFTILVLMSLLMVMQVIPVLVALLYICKIPMYGSVFSVFACILIARIGGMSLGIFLSAISSNETICVMTGVSIYSIYLTLCGVFWPIEAMSTYVKYVSYCLPLTLFSYTTRCVFLRGWSITEHDAWIGLAVSFAWIIVFLLFAGLIFNRKK